MAALGKKLRSVQAERGRAVMFWCPGCNEGHKVLVDDGPAPRWSFNGNGDRPTFRPSVRVQWPDPDHPGRYIKACHSWVTDGQIEFLADSTHHLSGQTVDLPDWPHITDMT